MTQAKASFFSSVSPSRRASSVRKRAEHVVDDGFAVAGDENEVAGFGVQPLGQGNELIYGEKLGNRPANLARVGLNGQPGQRLGPLGARQASSSSNCLRLYVAAAGQRRWP
jgi:hypothetical protein